MQLHSVFYLTIFLYKWYRQYANWTHKSLKDLKEHGHGNRNVHGQGHVHRHGHKQRHGQRHKQRNGQRHGQRYGQRYDRYMDRDMDRDLDRDTNCKADPLNIKNTRKI
jgi:hypothetical protein